MTDRIHDREIRRASRGTRRLRWIAAGAVCLVVMAGSGIAVAETTSTTVASTAPDNLIPHNASGNSGPGPGEITNPDKSTMQAPYIETTAAGRPIDAQAVPSSIPAQGVFVDDNFELFPPGAGDIRVSGSQAIQAAEDWVSFGNDPPPVTTVLARFTNPASLAAPGQSTLHQLRDVPAWIVTFTTPDLKVAVGAVAQDKDAPSYGHLVVIVDAYSGQAVFQTPTP